VNDVQFMPVEGVYFYTFDFTDSLPATVTVTACAFTITPSITLAGQIDDFVNNKSTIKVSGALHGVTYNLQAKATLSNTESCPKDVCLVGFNG
jgi:hypothetical protein